MNRKLGILLLALVAALSFGACGKREETPPPDLTGYWMQVGRGEDQWYHIAAVTGDRIAVYFYEPSDNDIQLYWYGAYTLPETGKEPCNFTSTNLNSKEYLDKDYHFARAIRDEEKIFTYQKEHLCYVLMDGHLRLGMALERVDPSEFPDTSKIVLSENETGWDPMSRPLSEMG